MKEKKRIIQIQPTELFCAAVLWVLLINGGGYLSYITPLNVILPIVVFIALIAYTFVKNIRFTSRELIGVCFIVAYSIFLYLFHSSYGDQISSYIKIILDIIIVLIFNKIIKTKERFIFLFVNVVLFICAYSCVCYVLNLIFDFTSVTPMTGTLYRLWMGQNVRSLTRNAGPFWEPGIFQIYINIALYFALFFYRGKKDKFPLMHITIYVITLISTLSTTAYLLMGILLMWKYLTFVHSLRRKQIKVTMFILAPVVILIGGTILLSTSIISDKFQDNNRSYIARTSDLEAALPIIRESGMLGKGANTIERQSLMIRHGIRAYGAANSVGYSSTASMYGWLTLLIFMFRILYVCWMNFRKQWILLYGIMLVVWTTGAIMMVPLYYFFFIGFDDQPLFHSESKLSKERYRMIKKVSK